MPTITRKTCHHLQEVNKVFKRFSIYCKIYLLQIKLKIRIYFKFNVFICTFLQRFCVCPAGLSLFSVEAVTHLVSPRWFWPLAELAAAFLAIPSHASPLPVVSWWHWLHIVWEAWKGKLLFKSLIQGEAEESKINETVHNCVARKVLTAVKNDFLEATGSKITMLPAIEVKFRNKILKSLEWACVKILYGVES